MTNTTKKVRKVTLADLRPETRVYKSADEAAQRAAGKATDALVELVRACGDKDTLDKECALLRAFYRTHAGGEAACKRLNANLYNVRKVARSLNGPDFESFGTALELIDDAGSIGGALAAVAPPKGKSDGGKGKTRTTNAGRPKKAPKVTGATVASRMLEAVKDVDADMVLAALDIVRARVEKAKRIVDDLDS